MASEEQRYNRAIRKWEIMHDNGHYSVPADIGHAAIVCSYFTTVYREPTVSSVKVGTKEVRQFRNEAIALTEQIEQQGQPTVTVFDAKPQDMDDVLRDPTISDVFIIGHGNLSSICMKNTSRGYYDWEDVHGAADHLKTGQFVQRHCGGITRKLPVPLGSFCVANHTNVIAPVGLYFNPRGLLHPDNALLSSVSPCPVMSVDYIANRLTDSQTQTQDKTT